VGEARLAIQVTAPLLLGLFPYGVSYGVSMVANGWGALHVGFASATLFSGVAQFAAIELMKAESPLGSLALAALIINARHIPMGLSIAPRYQVASLPQRLLLGYWLCEESFAVNATYPGHSVPEGFRHVRYFLLTSVMLYLCWVGSSVLGALIGTQLSLPADLLTFVVPLVFGCLLVETIRTSHYYGPVVTTLIVAVGAPMVVPRAYRMMAMIFIPTLFHALVLAVGARAERGRSGERLGGA
jgi:4-azaleucine resistance transporter AzlC